MAASPHHHETAKILAFPAGGRDGLDIARRRAAEAAAATVVSRPPVQVAVGSGWYHEAAIEAERAAATGR